MAELERESMRGGIVPVHRLKGLREDIESLRDRRMLDPGLYDAYLNGGKFSVPDKLSGSRSIVVVAVPVPRIRLHFTWQGNDVAAIIPPTYADAADITSRCGRALERAVASTADKFERAILPVKTLAARCGVAR
ncbi:MAG TPA: hypothetical protein VLH13_03870, partial [Methanomassiliicoccales archaeon]|nr:hypothetical protein [Methanomassiliicoccales archaeon]